MLNNIPFLSKHPCHFITCHFLPHCPYFGCWVIGRAEDVKSPVLWLRDMRLYICCNGNLWCVVVRVGKSWRLMNSGDGGGRTWPGHLLGCKSHLGQLGCKSESENRIFILLTPSAKVPRLARGCYAVDEVFKYLVIWILLKQIFLRCWQHQMREKQRWKQE